MKSDEVMALARELESTLGDRLTWNQGEPATELDIESAESAIGSPLPPELKDFLRTANGLTAEIEADDGGHDLRIMSLDAIVENTLSRRDASLYGNDLAEAWRDVVAFADVGDGNLLALDLSSDPTANVLAAYNDVRPEDLRTEGHLEDSLDDFLRRTFQYALSSGTAFSYWLN